MAQRYCPIHSIFYDDSFGGCPQCAGGAANRPPAPMPLSEDDMPTDPGAIPGQYVSGRNIDEEAPTGMNRPHTTRRLLDPNFEDDKTELGRERNREEDTEILNRPETGMLGLLWVREGGRRGKVYNIKDGTVVGRSTGSADVVLDDSAVSKIHAKFRIEDKHFTVTDFDTDNGTLVNGQRIRAKTTLQENDLIGIGRMVFMLKVME